MRAVGIKELKNKLSEYVRLSAAGESVLVTDRGRVVAELTPPRPDLPVSSWSAKRADLIRRGLLTPARDKSGKLPPRPPPIMTRVELLAELARDREDR
jgi:prevent-host-death family protein